MPLKIVLLVPRRRFIANRFGLGYQVPLGLVLIGGPLLDAGHRVRLIDNDVLNAVYLTPHFWTPSGRAVRPAQVIQADQAFYTYRNQVLRAPRLSPGRLFWGVKLTEILFHLRPRGLWRALAGPDRRYRQILRAYLAAGARTLLAEMGEFLFKTRFAAPGSLKKVSGFPEEANKILQRQVVASLR